MRIALTGNPNSGKTTMYNALTGRNEKIGNWAGVTVDKKESPIKKVYNETGKELIAVDLPGAHEVGLQRGNVGVSLRRVADELHSEIVETERTLIYWL